ncbi:uncharacterized protein LOC129230043 [Uloborus diversus]|uniref:uncharacterized protein LOC129230043 n=1 Tax=Uloborus diversus TaxID=327109 RepID=UPI002409F84C|nr:uncharacterized protein LOC129230043 [Uloborus diversus]
MEASNKEWITAITFEHSCKNNLDSVVRSIMQKENDFTPKLSKFCISNGASIPEKPQVKPIFFFIVLLRKFHQSLTYLKMNSSTSYSELLPEIVKLMESTFQQYNFMSVKKFLHFISELKLLDLMNLLTMNVESSEIIAKLNEHYPRWSPQYKSNLQKEFNIENPKVLNYIEASHTQCRRLVLKLAIDQAYKSTYMTDQYSSDVQQIIEESRKYINEVIAALEEISGTSVIEKLLSGEEKLNTANLSHHLLLESLEPNMTESDLLQFLEDFDREDSTQQTSSLASCLLPFGAILSDDSESEGESDSCSGTSGTDSES